MGFANLNIHAWHNNTMISLQTLLLYAVYRKCNSLFSFKETKLTSVPAVKPHRNDFYFEF
ncbi:hypothetical protein KUTeg_000752 [Tegillarca granosa]|uniref:Uncharacterized protein n=1 Tax=Tegillarca granosa TaxID=220873 RepID=A0ABQ9FYF1_TEGGR|nr:hypothetical protein KUTeg_000752 [Tegillarca granosa]